MRDAAIRGQEEIAGRINGELEKLALAPASHTEGKLPWIIFFLGEDAYAIHAGYVLLVSVLQEIIPYLEAPAHCPGVVWERGMIRLLDLRALLGNGDYLSAVNGELPMIIVLRLNSERRGMIVDKILAMAYAEALVNGEDPAHPCYVQGRIRYRPKAFALIINPKSLGALEFERQDAPIDWKGRVDLGLKSELRRTSPRD